jgi:hypothetical protein
LELTTSAKFGRLPNSTKELAKAQKRTQIPGVRVFEKITDGVGILGNITARGWGVGIRKFWANFY